MGTSNNLDCFKGRLKEFGLHARLIHSRFRVQLGGSWDLVTTWTLCTGSGSQGLFEGVRGSCWVDIRQV